MEHATLPPSAVFVDTKTHDLMIRLTVDARNQIVRKVKPEDRANHPNLFAAFEKGQEPEAAAGEHEGELAFLRHQVASLTEDKNDALARIAKLEDQLLSAGLEPAGEEAAGDDGGREATPEEIAAAIADMDGEQLKALAASKGVTLTKSKVKDMRAELAAALLPKPAGETGAQA
jgi:hypothetical protein